VRSRLLHVLELTLLSAGVLLTLFYAGAHIDSYLSSRAAIAAFEVASSRPAPAAAPKPAASGSAPTPAATAAAPVASLPARPAKVDFSLWSPGRIRAYRRSLARDAGAAIALLRVPKIHLLVPVFDGTSDLVLNRGVGRIAGTALPGQPGNLGLAGHRDGFFRGLRNVGRGDTLELVTGNGTAVYRVDRIEIVSPDDVSVLRPRQAPSLTLVTCYPFYYIGHAPKRYVVEASLSHLLRNRNPGSGGDLSRKQQDRRSAPSRNAVQGEGRR
jgi:sortase A